MKIIGPDTLVFGVDDVGACNRYFTDFGLRAIEVAETVGRFEALDGSGIVIRRRDDPRLPAPLNTGSSLRETIYGVADQATLDAIRAEIGKDREVVTGGDGSIAFLDDIGFALRFQVTIRRPIEANGERINAAGRAPGRAMNELAVDPHADLTPRTLSHVVYFVPDASRMEAFYAERLGFRTVDRFIDVGPFMQPAGNPDHHTLFMIQTPPHMLGLEHVSFHMAGPSGMMRAGSNLASKDYQTFWGPGRHHLGGNWFWYFNSPLGCHVEYDADMDVTTRPGHRALR